ncbi:hypothetical protein H9P43_004147 [Blastocladiella emersonii ATCC 22665]|nr:hypothetical protein H9P43_004147 [Blastocladiella emersonii ATCC 22665]
MMTSSSSGYKGPAYVSLLSTQGSTPLNGWNVLASTGRPTASEQLAHHTKRVYERELKGFCVHVDSQSVKLEYTTKSATGNQSLYHPFLAIQAFVPTECKKVTLELSVTDSIPGTKMTSKRRLFLSTASKEFKTTPLHASFPIDTLLPRDRWTTLLIDLSDFVCTAYRNCQFRSLESITIQGDKIRLRNIVAVRDIVPASTFSSANDEFPGSRSSTALSTTSMTSSAFESRMAAVDTFLASASVADLDACIPRQYTFPFTMAGWVQWTVVRGTTARSMQILPSSANPAHAHDLPPIPGRLKKVDSGLSISMLSPSPSIHTLVGNGNGNGNGADAGHSPPATAGGSSGATAAAAEDAAASFGMLSLAERARRRRAALTRVNGGGSQASLAPLGPPSSLPPPLRPLHHTGAGGSSSSLLCPAAPGGFTTGIPRPSGLGGGTGGAPIPMRKPLTPLQPLPSMAAAAAAVPDVDPFDLEVQRVIAHATQRTTAAAPVPAPAPAPVQAVAPPPPAPVIAEPAAVAAAAAPGGSGEDGDDSLELVYDEELDCYYDPLTGKYYNIQDDGGGGDCDEDA